MGDAVTVGGGRRRSAAHPEGPMPPRTIPRLLLTAAVAACGAAPAAEEHAPLAEADRAFFETRIRPVLVNRCYGCHSADAEEPRGGLLLDTRAALLAGGESGPAVVPGEPGGGLLMGALRHETSAMPPEERLPEAVIAAFELWIARGAPDPRGEPAADAEPGGLWSLRPPRDSAVPDVRHADWPAAPVDRFLLARMEAAGVAPVEPADRRTLIRRLSFDLTGLPPTPTAVRRFVGDPAPDAFSRLVDRLLASPAFGERWGRHWLDAARFAESTGHERNFTYPHAWRYREYVIDAFNADKPYDQFLREQLAGDLLSAEDPAEADDWRRRDERRVATGFLALGPKNLLGDKAAFPFDVADDQIDAVSRAMLGLTVSCARCHDHKFDPISTADYYALAGVFRSTEVLYGTPPGTGGGNNRFPADLLPLGPDGAARHAAVVAHRAEADALVKPLGKAEAALKKARAKGDEGRIATLEEDVERLEAERARLLAQAPPAPPYAMGVRDAGKPVDVPVLIGGDPRDRGDVIPRRLPAELTAADRREVPPGAGGRLELAGWVTDPGNPLTGRVMVNRVWHHLFGRGLVETLDNFGAIGRRPTHPDLLDHLAVRFVTPAADGEHAGGGHGWSVKSLVRALVHTRAYRLSSRSDAANERVDADDTLLWRARPRRLEAEALRDAMLAASGDLRPGRPPEGSVVATLGDGCLVRQIATDPLLEESDRRSVYLPACRHLVPEALDLFDGASPSLVVGGAGRDHGAGPDALPAPRRLRDHPRRTHRPAAARGGRDRRGAGRPRLRTDPRPPAGAVRAGRRAGLHSLRGRGRGVDRVLPGAVRQCRVPVPVLRAAPTPIPV